MPYIETPVDVPEAANMLGISQTRVKQLIANHQLPAHRIGRIWAIPHAYLLARMSLRFPSCRPYEPRTVWDRINAGDVDLSDGVRYQKRGRITRWSRGYSVPDRIASKLGGMLSGAAAATEMIAKVDPCYGTVIPPSSPEYDLYLPASKYHDLVNMIGELMNEGGNTVIRFVDDEVWDLASDEAIPSAWHENVLLAPIAAVALDIRSYFNARHRDAGVLLMEDYRSDIIALLQSQDVCGNKDLAHAA